MGKPSANSTVAGLWAMAALLCLLGFYDAGLRYEQFQIPYGYGVYSVPPPELAFYAWLLVFGLPAWYFATRALDAGGVAEGLLESLEGVAARRRAFLFVGAVFVLGSAWAVHSWVLLDAPIADDESTYLFIAQTLLEGRVTNPSPGDVSFFANQFVILDSAGWYGKYPIGHPLVLALGEWLGARALVIPAVTAASFALTFAVGRRIFPEREALLGTGLLLLSPHFLFTGGTQLSQPTAGLCLLAGLWALLRLADDPRARWALLVGAAWGAGVLVRPLPGALFLAVAGIWGAYALRSAGLRRLVGLALVAAVPVLACGAVMLAVQHAQTGNPFESGYRTLHGAAGLLAGREGRVGNSIGGALLRQNFWLFGWPLSLLFLPFARRNPRVGVLWAMVAAEYAYRLIAPKTVVASTGPIYVTEIVPLLALASGSGMVGAARRLRELGIGRARESVAALVVAGFALAMLSFVPIHLRELHRSGRAWQTANHLLEATSPGDALVFADLMVHPMLAQSWAYYPPNPSPSLDEPTIFVRLPDGDDSRERAIEFWQRRFPARSAWVFRFEDLEPVLRPLEAPAPATRTSSR